MLLQKGWKAGDIIPEQYLSEQCMLCRFAPLHVCLLYNVFAFVHVLFLIF